MALFDEIWKKVSKDDGTGSRFIKYESDDDLVFIYASGFVDADKCDLKTWMDVFASSLQEDGSYLVSQDQWMAKEKYYYDGTVRLPFDPMLIPEKEYSEAEVVEIYQKCIIPSSQASADKINVMIRDYKERRLLKDGKMTLTRDIKEEMRNFITAFPSPLRILEINVQRMLEGESPIAAAAEAGKTGFKMGATTVQTTQAQLDSILGGSRGGPTKAEPGKESLSVKDLQKQVKKRPV